VRHGKGAWKSATCKWVWKSPLKPNRLGKAADKRLEKAFKGLEKLEELKAKWLGKACWSAWMGLHGCFLFKQCLFFNH
jgi:hypothetical protein